ncbi:MAG: hypothetical protein HOP30_15510 [Cyclobacteriaceae bacterium]|nr:hypothetical protein [Cyclobacteriaceae bacterium]
MEVLVFATSVQSTEQVKTLAPQINSLAGRGRWNFALDDCDKILRIASDRVQPQQAVALLEKYGFKCSELD